MPLLTQHPLAWSVGFSPAAQAAPEAFVAATVPGAVQLDWARAHDWPPYTFGDNPKEYA